MAAVMACVLSVRPVGSAPKSAGLITPTGGGGGLGDRDWGEACDRRCRNCTCEGNTFPRSIGGGGLAAILAFAS